MRRGRRTACRAAFEFIDARAASFPLFAPKESADTVDARNKSLIADHRFIRI